MSDATLLEELTELFEDVMDIDDVELHDDTTAEDIEEWDSLSHVRLIVAIERQYGIKFTNPEIEGLKRLKDIVELIEAKKAA